MSIRVIFDESHGEQFSFYHLKGLSYVLEKLEIIPYRLLGAPITLDKIANEDALFLGAPTKKFLDIELKTLEYFISKGKSLIVVCPVPMPLEVVALNEIIGKFGIHFEQNMVEDKKHNLNGAIYFPIIKVFEKDFITRDIKEIIYSGCSIKRLNPSIKLLAFSDDHAEPPSAPVIVATPNNQVICIGGSTIFQDDNRYGIKAKNNIRLVANIFRSIQQRRQSDQSEAQDREKAKKIKPIDPKKAKKYFEKLTADAEVELEKISTNIDNLYNEILDIITAQNYPLANQTLQTKYTKLKVAIEGIYQELMSKLEELDSRIKSDVDFTGLVKDSTDAILVKESEVLSKLDMIRYNLINRISKEKIRS